MRIRKLLSKIAFTSLAVLMTASAIPYHSGVKAATDEYPDEVYFPIRVLDFSMDNLLFEWAGGDGSATALGLYENIYTSDGHINGTGTKLGNGRGLVENELGPDGLPVYKRETVEYIAVRVQNNLKNNWGTGNTGKALNTKIDDVYNDMSLRKYIRADVPVLNWYTNKHLKDDTIWLPEGGDPSITYTMQPIEESQYNSYKDYGSGANYNEIYAEVYSSADSTKPVYLLRRDGITFLSKASVTRTFTGLPANYGYKLNGNIFQGNSSKTEIWINGSRVYANNVVTTDANGELKVTIKVSDSLTEPVDASNQQLTVANIMLTPTSTEYPLGDYDQSKAKFDGNPDLGWTDITTCMDYAYFVTSHFFKYHPSLNSQYNEYDNLIFHKTTDKRGNLAYEFAADSGHKPNLIYNKDSKTIRNATTGDAGDTTKGDVVKTGGSMFICDDAPLRYPSNIDPRIGANVGGNRNFHFTISSHSQFVYKREAEQFFEFSGDDDVYVFVNGHLYMDLGGAHSQISGKIKLPEVEDKHPDWIKEGEPVSLDFFYMERHSTASNFWAFMNFELANDMITFKTDYDTIPYGYLVDLNYSMLTFRELTTNSNFTFTDNFGNIIGADGFYLAEGVSLKDNKLKIIVTDKAGNETTKVIEFVDPNNPTPAEVAEVQNYFKNLTSRQGGTIKINGPQFDTSVKPFSDDTLFKDVAGETVNTKSLTFQPTVKYDARMDGAVVSTTNTLKATETAVNVITGSMKVFTADVDNEKKDLADYGAFTIERDLSLETKYATAYKYENDPDAVGRTEATMNELARGRYTIKLDPNVLTSYIIYINGEEVPATGYDPTKERELNVIYINELGVPELTLEFEPEYDFENNVWNYPDKNFELRAKRRAPDLKDLT